MKHVSELPAIWNPVVGLDIETTMREVKIQKKKKRVSSPFEDKILAVGVSDGYNSWYLTDNYKSLLSLWLDPDAIIVIHNAAFDLQFLVHELGVYPKAFIWDTLLVERILHTGDSAYAHALADVLARRYGVILNKATRDNFLDHSGEFTQEEAEYLEKDVLYLPRLYQDQLKDIGGKLVNPFTDEIEPGLGLITWLELTTLKVTVKMTLAGVYFDSEQYNEQIEEIKRYIASLEDRIVMHLCDFWHEVDKKFVESYTEINRKGKEVVKKRRWVERIRERKYVREVDGTWELVANLNSPPQVLKILHDLGFDKLKSTSKGTLLPLIKEHPFIEEFLEYKLWAKLLTWNYPSFIAPTGRIHAKWNQLVTEDRNTGDDEEGTDTGRFSCSDPNLQQVPKPRDGTPNMRANFKPRPGYKFVIADFSQQEPRILAEISADSAMIKAAKDTDIYSAYGEAVYGHRLEKGSKERDIMKIAVLAHFYGARKKRMAGQLGVSEDEAASFQNRINRAFPTAKAWGNRQLRILVQRGYLTTLWGRIRYVPDIRKVPVDRQWTFDNLSRNTPIQGTAADIGKLAMIILNTRLEEGNYDARIVMVIHDEVVVEVREDQAEAVEKITESSLLDAMQMVCPNVLPGAEVAITDYWRKV